MSEICNYCGGTGQLVCDLCKGTGNVPITCPTCGGVFEPGIPPGAPGSPIPEKCETCFGKGTVPQDCNYCGGTGQLVCDLCKGTGTV